MDRYASGPFAPFPLTLTLSLREREQRASRSESRKVWIVLRGEKGSPSPQGRGPGWGKGPPHAAARMSSTCRAADARRVSSRLVGIHDFEPPAMPEVSDSMEDS